jgi:hypothetical protein
MKLAPALRYLIPGRSALTSIPNNRRHNALKYAGFSATSILPGEDAAEFEKLHQALVSEFRPNGALEQETVGSLAHLLWRKKNLVTFRMAQRAQQRVIPGRDNSTVGSYSGVNRWI